MDSILMLVNEIPGVMAPAFLIAALLAASLFRVMFRFKRKPFKVMVVGVMLAFSAGVLMMRSIT